VPIRLLAARTWDALFVSDEEEEEETKFSSLSGDQTSVSLARAKRQKIGGQQAALGHRFPSSNARPTQQENQSQKALATKLWQKMRRWEGTKNICL
jgi:hypothetical protein